MNIQPKLCLCGCGTVVFPDSQGRERSYVRNHHRIGKKHSAETMARISASFKKAWEDPTKFKALRHQSHELIEKRISKIRGRKQSLEVVAARSALLKGRKAKPEAVAKLRERWRNGITPTLSQESESARIQAISKALTGTHGFGRGARDRPDHHRALHWIVRDSCGMIHEFDNLLSWCRANEWRFMPDERPDAKRPLWYRAASGICGQQRTDRKGAQSWKGWTLVSGLEREEVGAPDLLGRDYANLQA